MTDLELFRNKNVFITGHTGFKGSWLSKLLLMSGARLTGYSLAPPTEPNLFSLCGLEKDMNSVIGDIRDLQMLQKTFEASRPEIVLHLAAQPIVRESYRVPAYTYETNVMGTVNILECVRNSNCVQSFLNVTTDKVYQNNEWEWGYRENEPLDGFDPYSNSKSCSELVTHSYRRSFFADGHVAISTARAGNVIGGGDFAMDRIIPDCVRAAQNNTPIIVRNPHSTRPYQHVLDPLMAYLMIAGRQAENGSLSGYYNVGPDDNGCVSTSRLVDLFCQNWGEGLRWENQMTDGPHEANYLKLDCTRLKSIFGWSPRFDIERTIEMTVAWTKQYLKGEDMSLCMENQISDFLHTDSLKNVRQGDKRI
jgi:CDP-glucose 4,6-dehydratase